MLARLFVLQLILNLAAWVSGKQAPMVVGTFCF
jgi:hypothetical protein